MAENDEPAPSKTIGALFLGIGGVSVLALAIIAARIGTAASPLCNTGFPGRQGQFPTWVFVFIAIGAFAVGHLTGSDRAGRRRKAGKALGEGQWQQRKAIIAVNAGVAVFMFLVTALMAVEALTLAHHVWPITYYTRCANVASTPLSLLGSAVYAFVIGRWLWVFGGE
jgi:ABC-type Na+ efflux pump permease subunit